MRVSELTRLMSVIGDYKQPTDALEWKPTQVCLPKVIRTLNQLKETRGLPKMIRGDNGPEFLSQKFSQWCKEYHITLVFNQG